eukprot:7615597-Ditylum_brightwellii.AAC.1
MELTLHVLHVSEKTQEFIELQEENTTYSVNFHTLLKGKIVWAMKIDLHLLHDESKKHFIKAFHIIPEVLLTLNSSHMKLILWPPCQPIHIKKSLLIYAHLNIP